MTHRLDSISLGKIVQIREKLLQAAAQGKKVYRFESGDPSFIPASHIREAAGQAAYEGKTHYVPNDGIPELRRALAQKLQKVNRIAQATEKNIFITNGAMHALYVTFFSLLDPGDEVIVPEPMWTEVVENIRLAGGIPVPVRLEAEKNYEYGAEEIEKRISPRTKAIFVNTPHNPTGAVLSKNRLQEISELAREHQLWIVSDEAYEDVLFPPHEHFSIAALTRNDLEKIVSIFSFSKSHAMAGLRIGYLVTFSKLLQERIPKALRCTLNGVNSLAQWAAVAAVQGPQDHVQNMRKEYLERKNLMWQALQGIPGLRPFEPQGTFFIWTEVEKSLLDRLQLRTTDEIANALAEKGLGSTPGDAFGESCQRALRFAFSCSTEMIREGSPLLRNFLLGSLR